MFYALSVMNLGDATTLFFTSPVFTAIFSWLFVGERISPLSALASVVSVVGVVLVARPAFLFDPSQALSAAELAGAAAARPPKEASVRQPVPRRRRGSRTPH